MIERSYTAASRDYASVVGMGFRSAWLLLVAVWACDAPKIGAPASEEPQCKSISGALPGIVKFAECNDSRTRELRCNRATPDELEEEIFCACMIGETMGASFTLFSDVVDASADPARAVDIGHRRCGWELVVAK